MQNSMRKTHTISGTVLLRIRQSASLTTQRLAAAVGVSEAAVRGWEDGSDQLALEPLGQLDKLSAALVAAGAAPELVADLAVAVWCDVVLDALAEGSDASCLLADPLAQGPVFSELLAWSTTGEPPVR